MKIETYSFGKMQIDGKSYTSDLVVYPDRIDPSWWRKKGHLLQMEDLTEILEEKPEILILGTGSMGVMRVPGELKEELLDRDIELYVERTARAVEIFNTVDRSRKTVAAFHLTC